MKKYIEMQMEIVILQTQDIVTMSGFAGGDHEFGNPNSTSASADFES